jgi:hypothetical protein
MAERVNQQIADRLVRRQLQAGRVETALRQQVFAQLALLESEILSALKSNDPTEFVLLARRRRDIEQLMSENIDPLVAERYRHIAVLLDAAMLRLAKDEAGAIQTIVNTATDEPVIEEQPSDRQLRAGVINGLFPSPSRPVDASTIASDWWTRAGLSVSLKVHDTLTVGVALEETLTDLARRIRGTAENGFADGVLGRAKTDAARLLTTQMTNTLGETRAAVAAANASRLIVIHQSVLDSSTSYVCLGRHGLKYTADTHEGIGHAIPYLSGVPYHPNCRSSIVPALADGGPIMQESARAWLRRQGPAVQDEVLGPTRARMWREGRLSSPRQLLEATSGTPLTLEELGA